MSKAKRLLAIEQSVMEANMSDTAALGEALIALIEVMRDHDAEITKLNAQLARVHEAVPSTAEATG